MSVVEKTIALPDWFEWGVSVNPYLANEEFDVFIDSDYYEDRDLEEDADWRFCQIPISALRLPSSVKSEHEFLDRFPELKREHEQDPCSRAARLGQIKMWIRDFEDEAPGQGALHALTYSPVILTLESNGKVQIEDGKHRLALAAFYYDLKAVPSLCLSVQHEQQRYRPIAHARPKAY